MCYLDNNKNSTRAIAPVIRVRGKIYTHAIILSIISILITRRSDNKAWLRKPVWVPNSSTTFPTELAAETHLSKGQFCYKSRHWTKQNLCSTGQELEDQQLLREEARVYSQGKLEKRKSIDVVDGFTKRVQLWLY